MKVNFMLSVQWLLIDKKRDCLRIMKKKRFYFRSTCNCSLQDGDVRPLLEKKYRMTDMLRPDD